MPSVWKTWACALLNYRFQPRTYSSIAKDKTKSVDRAKQRPWPWRHASRRRLRRRRAHPGTRGRDASTCYAAHAAARTIDTAHA